MSGNGAAPPGSNLVDLVIISGQSGAGKSSAMNVFEDAGYFCVDNLPPEMIRALVELFVHEGSKVERAAVVSDQRGGATTWTVSVISTAFTPPAGPADPASNVSYAAGTITMSAGVVATGVAASNLTGVTTVVTGTSTGISSASWNPTISVLVPGNFAPGVYGATITHSVA
jgi:hypothetical protein